MHPEFSPTEVFFAATTAGRSWRGAVIEAEERAKQVGADTFVYQLDWSRASHALDISLVFDNTKVRPASDNVEKDKQMAEIMCETLLAFAKTGNPNNAKIPEAKVNVVNGTVKVEGASLLAIYNVVGQEVKNRDLPSGVYIVRIFKADVIALVKIAI